MNETVLEEIRNQAIEFGIHVEPIEINNTKVKEKLAELDLAEHGLRLNYEGYEYEVYYWQSTSQTCMFSRTQPTLTLAGSMKTTVQMMMQEIKERAASRG